MLKWLFVCDGAGCKQEARSAVLGGLPAGWMHRVIVDRSSDAAGGSSELQREVHYCAACKVKIASGKAAA